MNPVTKNSRPRFGESPDRRSRAAGWDARVARAIAWVGTGVGFVVVLVLAILALEAWSSLGSSLAVRPSPAPIGHRTPTGAGVGAGIDLLALGWGSLRVTAVALLTALLLAFPLAIAGTLHRPVITSDRFRGGLKAFVGSIAGLPWVVLGFVALTVLGPDTPLNGWGAGVAVGLALFPRLFCMIDDALGSVPRASIQAALALGATPSQAIGRAMLPAALPGILAAVLAVVGQSLVETMIVMGISGSASTLGWSLWDPLRLAPIDGTVGWPEALAGRSILVMLAMLPAGVLTGVHLAEYAPHGVLGSRLLRGVFRGLEGIPGGVFGLLGLGVVIGGAGLVGEAGVARGGSSPGLADPGLANWFRPSTTWVSLVLVIACLPAVVLSSEAALRSVPREVRASAMALGATRLEVLGRILLPNALPGIFRGVAMALGRVAGGLAPWLVAVAAFTTRGSTTPIHRSVDPVEARPSLLAVLWILVLLSILVDAAAAMLRSRTAPAAAQRD